MINDYCPQKIPDFFISNDCHNLLVTIGDSWTWGDSLGKCTANYDDLAARKSQCFGKKISEKLQADWLNLGFCGAGNGYLLKCLDDLISGQHVAWLNQISYDGIRDMSWPLNIQDVRNGTCTAIQEELCTVHCQTSNPYTQLLNKYKNVYIVLTLTETGRDASRYDWMHTCREVEQYLIQEEIYNYKWLNDIISRCKHSIVVARNFTVDFDETGSLSPCLPKNWVEINWDNNGSNRWGSINDLLISGPASGVVFDMPFLVKMPNYKKWFVNQTTKAEPLWHYLRNNSLNHNQATCHPTDQSHLLWANYILKQF